jgi:hypothetical protein
VPKGNFAMALLITRRNRIGFSWTNTPERWVDEYGQSHLRISDPGDEPSETGTVQQVWDQWANVCRLNNSNHWRFRWFKRHQGRWVQVQVLSITELQLLVWGILDSITVCSDVKHRIATAGYGHN